MRGLLRLTKIIDQGLRVFGLEVDDPRKFSCEMGVIGIEAFRNKLCVLVVLCKYNRFPKPIAIRDF